MRGILVAVASVLFFLYAAPASAENRMITAGWYGPGFKGKIMANQERFNSGDPTIAAHRKLPFGTKLLVQNPTNGRKLVVVVKDRGPYVKGRGLDLSYAGARHLGYIEEGVVQLMVTVIYRP